MVKSIPELEACMILLAIRSGSSLLKSIAVVVIIYLRIFKFFQIYFNYLFITNPYVTHLLLFKLEMNIVYTLKILFAPIYI